MTISKSRSSAKCAAAKSRKAAQIVMIYRDLLGLPRADSTNTSIGPPPRGYWAPSESDEQFLDPVPASPQDGFLPVAEFLRIRQSSAR